MPQPVSSTTRPSTISRQVEIQADAAHVWALLSDLPAMGALSPENAGGRWRGGVRGPATGARFRGANRQGWRRWSTSVRVTDCQPGRRFAFDVSIGGLSVATWAYDVVPLAAGGCRVTETWTDGRGWLIAQLGALTTGVQDRTAFTATSIEHTLDRLRERAEAPV